MGPPTLNSQPQVPSTPPIGARPLPTEHPQNQPETLNNVSNRILESDFTGEKTSSDRIFQPSQTDLSESSSVGEGHFNLLRDSLVFNHERLLRRPREYYTGQTSVGDNSLNSSPHYTSLTTITAPTELDGMGSRGSIIPYQTSDLYSISNDVVTEPRHQDDTPLDTDANYVGAPNPPPATVWLQARMHSRNTPLQQEELEKALQASNKLHFSNAMSGEQKSEIPLVGAVASLHLPSPPTSPLSNDEMCLIQQKPSQTTVTTMYSYKCERNKARSHSTSMTIEEEEEDKDNTPGLPTLHEGDFILPPTRTKIRDYAMQMLHDTEMEVDLKQRGHGIIIDNGEKLNDAKVGGDGDEPTNNHLITTDTDHDNVESKPNELNLSVNGDYATDEDLEEDLTTFKGQPQPLFPNPADLKWPDPTYLRMTLPSKYHPFLDSGCKKDCRVWLWKNRKGRKAREVLAMARSASAPKKISPSNSNTSLKAPRVAVIHQNPVDVPNHTLKAFTDNDDIEMKDVVEPNQQQQLPRKRSRSSSPRPGDFNSTRTDHLH